MGLPLQIKPKLQHHRKVLFLVLPFSWLCDFGNISTWSRGWTERNLTKSMGFQWQAWQTFDDCCCNYNEAGPSKSKDVQIWCKHSASCPHDSTHSVTLHLLLRTQVLLVARTIRNPVWYTRASIEFHHSNTEIIYGSQNPGWDLVHIQVVQGLPLSPCLAGVFFSVYFGAFSKRSAEEYPLRWSTETQGRWFSLGKGVLCLGSQQLLINYCSYRCCHLLFPDMFIKIQTLCL